MTTDDRRPRDMFLLIRSAADLDFAIASANEFLIHQRRRLAGVRDADELLGVWLRLARDTDLWSGASADMRESFSLLGIWSLCWVDHTSPSGTRSPEERRRRLFETLSNPAASWASNDPPAFIPVFDAAEADESIDGTVRELRREYPDLIGGSWFVDHPTRGLIGPKGTSDASVGSTRLDRPTHGMKKGTRL